MIYLLNTTINIMEQLKWSLLMQNEAYSLALLKLVILIDYQNIRTFFQKAMFKIGLKTFLWFKTLKTPFHGPMLLVILKAKKLLEHFTKNNCKNKSKRV